MDSQSSGLDFAIIGHQESWKGVYSFMNAIRRPENGLLTEAQIREMFSFVPPRSLFGVTVRSKAAREIKGVYIETFISPDELNGASMQTNLQKVKEAARCAERLGARIVSLGGFTSIVLEGDMDLISGDANVRYTTGNTLTASYIVKGVERAAASKGITLSNANILIIGATGDIGLACVTYFKERVAKVLLNARNRPRLEKLAKGLEEDNVCVKFSTDLSDLLGEADIVVAASSSSALKLGSRSRELLVCDAGYPKNIQLNPDQARYVSLFHGGMGCVRHGYTFDPDYSRCFYQFPEPFITHGCILEAMVLAFEESEFASRGKGNITVEDIERMYAMGLRHGVELAPFYNSDGLCTI